MSTKVCDFCFNEYKGLFTHTETLPDGHIICRSCRQKIESYGMCVKYDLFQQESPPQGSLILHRKSPHAPGYRSG